MSSAQDPDPDSGLLVGEKGKEEVVQDGDTDCEADSDEAPEAQEPEEVAEDGSGYISKSMVNPEETSAAEEPEEMGEDDCGTDIYEPLVTLDEGFRTQETGDGLKDGCDVGIAESGEKLDDDACILQGSENPIKEFTCEICWFTTCRRRQFVRHIALEHAASPAGKESGVENAPHGLRQRRRNSTVVNYRFNGVVDPSGLIPKPRKRKANSKKKTKKKTAPSKDKKAPKVPTPAKKNTKQQPIDRNEVRNRQYPCDMCDYKAYRLDHLKCHRVTHSGEKPFSCDQCSYTTPRRFHLKRHKMTHTGEKPFQCPVCDYRGVQHSHLTHHMATLHSIGPIVCDICPFTADQPRKLELHKLRVHSDRKPFACPSCDYTTSWRNLLKCHLVKHGAEAPYQCHTCGYKTAVISRLKRHLATHAGRRPYGCESCGYRATTLDHLKRHERVVHLGMRPSRKKKSEQVVIPKREEIMFEIKQEMVESEEDPVPLINIKQEVVEPEQEEALDYSAKHLDEEPVPSTRKRRRSSVAMPYVGFLAETTHNTN